MTSLPDWGQSRFEGARCYKGALQYLGYRPGEPDGVVGQNTRKAIEAFRRDANMGSSGELDAAVFDAIMIKVGWPELWPGHAFPFGLSCSSMEVLNASERCVLNTKTSSRGEAARMTIPFNEGDIDYRAIVAGLPGLF